MPVTPALPPPPHPSEPGSAQGFFLGVSPASRVLALGTHRCRVTTPLTLLGLHVGVASISERKRPSRNQGNQSKSGNNFVTLGEQKQERLWGGVHI